MLLQWELRGILTNYKVYWKKDIIMLKYLVWGDSVDSNTTLYSVEEFDKALLEYTKRDRRFGNINNE